MTIMKQSLRSVRVIRLTALFVLILAAARADAQALLQWNTFGSSGTQASQPSSANSAYILSSSITRGPGLSPAANSNRFGSDGWYTTGNPNTFSTLSDAIASDDYVQFTVTPVAGTFFTPASLAFSWDHSGTGPTALSLRSSADGYAADLGVITAMPASISSNTITISGLTNLSAATTFRLYGYGASGSTGTAGFDVASNVVNVQLNGASCVTPNAYSVTGGGMYCSGGAGVVVGLSGSEAGVSYQLMLGGSPVSGSVLSGTGIAISFGNQTAVGNYTVLGTRTTGGCSGYMSGAKTVAYNTSDINVQGFGNDIADGSSTPSSASLTHFNSVNTSSSITRSFTIQNLGGTALSITGTSITGANASDFTVSSAPASSVSAGGSTTFTVKFTPGGTGSRTAIIHIANGDCDEGDYDFAVAGTGRMYTDLYVDASATAGANDGTSWADAFTDFQSALSTASAGDTVYVAQGTYKPSIGIQPSPTARTNMFTLADGVAYYGGFPAGGGPLSSRDFSNYRTILSGDIGAAGVNTDNCFLVINAINLTASTILTGFTIENGRADSAGYTIYSRASAISLGSTGAMQLESLTVRDNTANVAVSGDGPVNWSVQHCNFSNNGSYGAVYIGGTGSSGAFANCSFTNNTGLNGGAISENVNSATFSFTDCSFTGNTGNYGGGGGAINAGNAANTFTNCSFTNNSSIGAGGALNKFYATANTFSYCTFTGNSGYGGGALYGQGGFNIDHCVFSQNYATGSPSTYSSHGGAIYNNGTPSNISNSVFRSNATLYGAGGAIYNNTGGTINLTNCTFTGNNAGGYSSGGALNNNSTSNANISNCIFWNNTANGSHANADAEIIHYNGTLNVSNTIWQGNNSGGTIYNADPLFTNAAAGDLTLQDCSPAIDSGASNSLATDIIGNPRPVDVFPGGLSNDIGAYERQIAPLPREINVRGNGMDIADGASTPLSANYTHFGSGITSRTFTIQNTASGGPLSISGVTITGTNAGDFSVITAPVSSVSANGATTFTIGFNQNAGGLRKAVIHIANSDCDEGDYDFAISGISIKRFYVDLSASGANNGSSWTNAFTDFQSALNLAASGDTVLVAKGTYKPSISIQPSPTPRTRTFTLANGVVYYGGFPQGGGAFPARNFAGNRTVLSGDIGTLNDSTDNCFLVVNAQNLSNTTLMSGFTIERGNGDSVDNNYPQVLYKQAGGINLGTSGVMRMDSVTVRNCFGLNGAGGIQGLGTHAITMRGCSFYNNNPRALSINYGGGQVFLNDTFVNNGSGGALYITDAGTFTGCVFMGNVCSSYGGVLSGGAGSTFTDCIFSNNSAGLQGGVLYSFYGVHTFTRCTFNQNSAGNDGGCIYIPGFTGGADFDRCIFNGNSVATGDGGAIYIANRSADIKNCVFWNNSASMRTGGAVYNNGGTMAFTNCSFAKNSCGSSQGGALNNNFGVSNISNCIFWGNVAAGNDAAPASEIGVGGSGAAANVSSTIWQGNNSGGSIYNADPLFSNPATGDLTLQDCSPAIDNGVANSLTTDAAGNPRPVDVFPGGLTYDIGAYERQTAPVIPEINVQGNGNDIADGSTAISGTGAGGLGTDFGNGPSTRSFTIQNTGPLALSVTGVSITGVNASDFSVTASAAGGVGPNTGSTSFTLSFTPSAAGTRTATIHIANSDCDEGDYDFAVQGTGCTAPVVSCNNAPITQGTDAGLCSASVSYNAATATGTSPTITYSKNSGTAFSKGTTIVTATATNGCGTDQCSFTITVNDLEKPAVTPPANVMVSGYCATAPAPASAITLGVPSTSDNCPGTISVVSNAPASYPPGTTTITWTATDASGNQNTATQTVTINPPATALSATAVAAKPFPMTGQKIQTVFLNYPASEQTDTLKINAAGGTPPYAYSWTMSGCNNTAYGAAFTPAPIPTRYVFAPDTASICSGVGGDNVYSFAITVTDDHGCIAMAAKRLNVVNPYTANGNVLVCHRVAARGANVYQLNTLTPAQAAIATNAGDQLGNCAGFTGRMTAPGVDEEEQSVTVTSGREVRVYPNPSTGAFTVALSEIESEADIVVTDVQGKIAARRIIAKDAPEAKASFDLGSLASGVYFIQVKDGTLNYRARITIQ